jgi:hypothetical protein
MDRAEAGLRAQTGEKPSGGYYTSSERITLQKFSLGRITTLPRSVFGGRVVNGGGGGASAGGGGGGGAVAAGSAIVVRPQTSLVDRAQTLQIQTNAQSIGGLQQSLDVIRVQVTELNQGIQNTARQLQAESALEQNQLKQEQEAERKLAERKVRLGKESELEKNIQAALMRPIAKLQQTVTSLFDRIMGALTTLFFGWLTNQGIETLKALAEGDTKKLEEIKNTVIKNVLFAIGAFAAVNLGFGLLMRTITGLTLKLGSFVARIALAPFRLAGAAIGRLLKFGGGAKPPVRPGGRVPITTSGGRVLSRSGPMANIFNNIKNFGKGTKTAARGVTGALPILGTFLDAIGAVGEFRSGNLTGAALYTAGAITSLIPGLQPLSGALSVTAFGQSMMHKSSQKTDTAQPPAATPAPPAATPTAATPAPPAAAQPQTPAIPSMSEITFGVDTANMLQGPTQSLTQETAPAAGTLNVEGLIQEKTPSADIQAPPKPNTPVGTLPEAKPNIIMAGGGKDRTQTMVSQQEPLTDVPFIPSSNTDNFYVLYSQLNYNVVM